MGLQYSDWPCNVAQGPDLDAIDKNRTCTIINFAVSEDCRSEDIEKEERTK